MTELSVNEIDALATKAARGAGFSWGLAEEVAQSARWLAGHGLAWDGLLLKLLEHGAAPSGSEPVIEGATVRPTAATGLLCPVRLGAYWSDCGAPAGLTATRVHTPAFVIPALARALAGSKERRILSWPGTTIEIGPGTAGAADWFAITSADIAATLTLAPASAKPLADPLASRPRPLPLGPDAETRLSALAARTYVKASMQSRLAGAGAGLSDND